jgi:YfiH family protein
MEWFFTTREGGRSEPPFQSFNLAMHVGDDALKVKENREILLNKFKIKPSAIFFMNQEHGSEVEVIDSTTAKNLPISADGLFTSTPGIALAVLVADCIPLILFSENAISVLHVGRRGLAAGIVAAGIERFREAGISSREIHAMIGPSICVDCYQVDLETYRSVVGLVPGSATNESDRRLDLLKGLSLQLEVRAVSWESAWRCTRESDDLFSFRRDAVTGRQSAVVML